VALEGVGEDTERSYSACLREISQYKSRKKNGLSHGHATLLLDNGTFPLRKSGINFGRFVIHYATMHSLIRLIYLDSSAELPAVIPDVGKA
jgi:hypothetical protein